MPAAKSMARKLARVLPVDPALAALTAFSGGDCEATLEKIGLRPPVRQVELLKYHPGSRCSFKLTAGGETVVVKAYRDDPSHVVELLRRMEAAGLGSGRPPTVAPVRGFDTQLRLVATAWLDGRSVRDLMDDRAGRRAGEVAAAWFRAGTGLHIDLGRRVGPDEVLTETSAFAHELWAAEPTLGRKAWACFGSLEAVRPEVPAYRLVHGAFSATAVMDLGSGPGIIDWDRFGQGALELDAGFLLARFFRLEHDHPSAVAKQAKQAKQARKAFLEGLNGLVEEHPLRWYRAAALVKAAQRRARRRGRRWEDQAGACLDEAQSSLAPIA